jgi:septal ring factor EnvC (AmiA/AmiB activator)
MNNNPLPLLDRLRKLSSPATLALSLLLLFASFTSKFSLFSHEGEQNSTQIEAIRSQLALQQKQLDQNAAIEEHLKALAEQNKMTQDQVHELSMNLQNFESRFIVIPTVSPALRR